MSESGFQRSVKDGSDSGTTELPLSPLRERVGVRGTHNLESKGAGAAYEPETDAA
jgi:hypothetical protein